MMVVADTEDEPYLPLPSDLLVPLSENRKCIENLLNKLPNIFKDNKEPQNNLGAALNAAQKLLSSIGGKIIVLQASLPDVGPGALKVREDGKALGTPKESSFLQPAINYYKTFAVDCSPLQISIDVFLFGPNYSDVATLSGCSRFTGGSLYYYSNFSSSRYEDSVKFGTELMHLLSRPLGLEAVLRVRASKGIKMTAFHGNFFLRSTDLLAVPNVNPDNCYCAEMSVTENINASTACFQTALLHTSSCGERRIRVLTLAVPLTSHMSEVFSSVDQAGMAALLAKKGIFVD
jgi:protein transport protein SEC24